MAYWIPDRQKNDKTITVSEKIIELTVAALNKYGGNDNYGQEYLSKKDTP